MSLPAGSNPLISYRIPGSGQSGEATIQDLFDGSFGSGGQGLVRPATGWTCGGLDTLAGTSTPGYIPFRGDTSWSGLQCVPVVVEIPLTGTASIGNDIWLWYVVCQNLTIVSGFICAKTAPTVTDGLYYDIKYNRAGAGFTSLFAGGQSPYTLDAGAQVKVIDASTMAAALVGGLTGGLLLISDILRIDCTSVGDTVAGADVTLQLICIPTPPA